MVLYRSSVLQRGLMFLRWKRAWRASVGSWGLGTTYMPTRMFMVESRGGFSSMSAAWDLSQGCVGR